ncbi:hypothetical protein RRF57_000401 [Xylaria bambusicola]|uniref:Uncharacterized protein n=1 Tax=Xylaria bambusicola TaxID=326684 RepID=A0AAN7UCT3_9PEZI
MRQFIEGDLGSFRVVHEPPGVTTDSSKANIGANNQVAEEEPASNKSLITLTWPSPHDVVVGGVEGQCSGWETVRDKVYPQQLNRN